MTDFDNGVPIEHYKRWGCLLGLGYVGFITLMALEVPQQVLTALFLVLFAATALLIIAELSYRNEHSGD